MLLTTIQSHLRQHIFVLFTGIFAAIASFLLAGGSGVFAWTNLGTINGHQYWSPNSLVKWAQFTNASGNRYLQVDAENMAYSSGNITQLHNAGPYPALVFHAFQQNSNCYVALNTTGNWWTNLPYSSFEQKSANCAGQNYSGNNEGRIWINSWNLNSSNIYFAGIEYRDMSPNNSGEVVYDGYGQYYWTGQRDYMGKFYFESNNSLHN